MKNAKPMSQYFADILEAPLINTQWSWGAENEKAIYLRVWQDEIQDNERVYLLEHSRAERRLGHFERRRHLKSIAQGKPGYVVVITDWTDTPDGNRNISAYQEAVYKIEDYQYDDAGHVWGKVNFDAPIFPLFVGEEINVEAIEAAASKNKTASALLAKATSKFNWRPTGICAQNKIISLLSDCGKRHAEIDIDRGTWKRL